MKKYIFLALSLFLVLSFSLQAQSLKKVKIENMEDSISYAIGMDIADNFEKQKIAVNPLILAKAMLDFKEKSTVFTAEQKNEVLMVFQQKLQEEQQGKTSGMSEENKKIGAAFLEANKSKEGVKVTPSGLQYKVIRKGEGPSPSATDMVTVHYRGKLLDGTTFDASYDRGEPIEFGLNQVIPGWTEGVQLMNAGSKYEFYIPSELAYGERGAGEVIPAGATLIFEVELISFKPGGSDWKIEE
ncbi:MAG: FKBP-type peptidyl-prolyl cis-trans isomerase [Bacteroidetes bacterium]|nr:FKBP-type peptidyl-prolyl cis-trans isomerase [Bacteroidota bacterium]